MQIEFDLTAVDLEAWDEWATHRLYGLGWALHPAVVVVGLSLLMLLELEFSRPRGFRQLIFSPSSAVPLGVLAALLAVRQFSRWCNRLVRGAVTGHHNLHFSLFGVHHVGPEGTYRYEWDRLKDVQGSVGHVFLRFREYGTVPIPVERLPRFGPLHSEAFLKALLPFIAGPQR